MQYNLILRNHKSSVPLVQNFNSSIDPIWPRNMQLILLFFWFDFHLHGFRLFGLKTSFGKDDKVDQFRILIE